MVVVCDYYPLDFVQSLNDMTRQLGKGFLSVAVSGLIGHIFTDLGSNHLVNDPNGEPKVMALVTSIDTDGTVWTEDK